MNDSSFPQSNPASSSGHDLLQAVFDNSPFGITLLEPVWDEHHRITDFRYLLVNGIYADCLNLTEKELTGRTMGEVVPSLLQDDIFDLLVAVTQTGQAQQYPFSYPGQTGTVWRKALLTPLASGVLVTIQDITDYKKAEANLQRRLDLESMIAALSSRLINLADADLDAGIVDSLRQICIYNGADRASVFLFSADQQRGSCVHEWCAPGIASLKNDLQNIPFQTFTWWLRMMLTGQVIRLGTLEDLPAEAHTEKSILGEKSIRSLLSIPLIIEGAAVGFVGFYGVQHEQTWDEADISLLKTFSTLIVNARKRMLDEEKVRRTNQRLQGLRTIDRALLGSNRPDESPILLALQHTNDLMPCERLLVFRISETTGLAYAEYCLADGVLEAQPDVIIPAEYFYTDPFLKGEPVVIPQLLPDRQGIPPELALYEQGFRSLVAVPLVRQQQCIGAFFLVARTPDFFTEEYLQIAREVASQLTVVLHQQQLHEQVKQYTGQLEQRVAERTHEIWQLSTWQKAILEHARQAIISTDTNGIVQTANLAIEQLSGYTSDELIGRVVQMEPGTPEAPIPIVSYQTASDSSPSERFKLALETDGFFYTECLILGKKGQRIPVLMTASALQDEEGRITGYVGIATDISALKAAEAKAEQTSRELKIFFERALDLHCITSLDGHFLKVNQAWTDTLGYRAEELEGQHFLEFVHPDDRAGSLEMYQQPVIDGYVNRYRHKDGSYRLIHWRAKRYEKLVYSSARDITERKMAEDALRESEQRFREIAENVDEVFWIQSADPFKLLYINPAYERVFGITSQRLYDDPFSFLSSVLPEDLPMVAAAFERYRQGEEIPIQYRVRGADGLIRWLNVRSFVMKDSRGIPLRCIGIATDISSQKEKELVLQQSLEREQELNKLKSQFVATASHEFRTPLATIQSSVDLIEYYLDRPEITANTAIQRHLGVIKNEIRAFDELLSDMLTIGRIEAGKVVFHPEPVDIVAHCQEIVATHFNQRQDHRTVRFVVEGKPVPVYLDEKLMSHVIVNLLSNAFKFSKANPELRIVFQQAQLLISVTDQGIGIPTADLPNLFQTFFRARNATSIQGTGLGLVIAHQFVKVHEGQLEVRSEEAKGTTFTITLPN
ncbi:hypothetical protein GCM10028803_61870 [Larkinella knui]|uniref:histidine kinase n=1 Tax=Larkinella knui TaxID=2025310 RepID=A0A3P1CB17_9BACT|nr:PAS domain S-box protein [Larkinella knui]RRB10517.1 PAS domain S-box protein [Larkinella knui]